MPENAPPPPPPMQFDVAQYSGDQRPPVSACTACKKPIAQTYYTANQAVICPECSQQIAQQLTGGSGFSRFCRALGLGIVGGLAGALLWFAVRRVTGYEVGLVAIVVGLLVGVAVRKGSRARGGWLYQLMAVLLTYLCICMQYVPDIVEEFVKEHDNQPAIVQVADGPGQTAPGDGAAGNAPAAHSATPGEPAHQLSPGARFVVALIIAIPISLVAPFFGGIIGILIVGFALYEAWKINKRMDVQMAGPFQLSTPAGAPAPPPIPAPAPVGQNP